MMGIQLTHVPCKGSAQAFNDLLGGSIDMMLTSATFSGPHIKDGKVHALGIAGTKRTPSLSDTPPSRNRAIPTIKSSIEGSCRPEGDASRRDRIFNKELNEVLKQKAVAERFEAEGTT